MKGGRIVPGSSVASDLRLEADAVIIGSGCAGAVMAHELTEAGFSCIVLEEGSHYTREQYGRFRPSESLRHLYRDYGATLVLGRKDTPNIYLLLGKCVGGSSVVNGGVCFRTPEHVLASWRDDHGLTEILPSEMDRAFSRVEGMLEVAAVPEELHVEGARRFIEASRRLGMSGRPLDRNVQGCDGCCRCIFGCPHDAKRSVLVTYLAHAVDRGATIHADARVRRILTRGGRAVGVMAEAMDPRTGRPHHRIWVSARVVVLAAGAVHSPLLMLESGLGNSSGQVGRNLTLHPAARAYGYFDDPVDRDRGAMQSYVVDEFYREAIKLVGIAIPRGILAATLPGFGRANGALMREATQFAAFGAMISDVSTGRVRRGVGGIPLITYEMLPEDKAKLVKAVQLLARIWFSAGARRVYLPFHLHPVLDSPDGIDALTPEVISGGEIESAAQHPLGTCRMGKDPRRSVVGPWGESHDVRGLYVVDASIVPTSVAVNPQITIMGMATRIAWHMAENRNRVLA